jgi:3-hydroxymyristoyl/3-hydroxydecanoyl-(acyl carrier protein) dehydratase
MLMPETLSARVEGAIATYRLRISPQIEHFRGHFPGMPLLPGVVQLEWAVRLGRLHFTGLEASKGIDNFKCQAIIFPGTELTLELKRDARGLRFRYADGERVYSSGHILFEGGA